MTPVPSSLCVLTCAPSSVSHQSQALPLPLVLIMSVYTIYFPHAVTNFPEGRLTISALDCLEAMAGISICNQLAPVFCTMAAVLHMDHSTLNYLRTENNPVEGSKAMFEAWISGKSSLPPTWKMLLEKLHTIGLGELAQRVEHFFNITPVASTLTSPVGCTCIVIIVYRSGSCS